MNDVKADNIAKEVIEKFESNKLKGKPVIRSNGVREWTVLAGVVAILPKGKIQTIAIATGVKALPDATIKSHSRGLLLHDCHAEILVLRAFNWFAIQECLKLRKSVDSEIFEVAGSGFKLKKGITFALYISEPPCGDASLELLIDESDEKWDDHTVLAGNVLRGREDFTLKGKVRTKPGRRDSPLTLSKSCSDKLTLKQYTSILNGVTSSFIDPNGLYIKYLILPGNKADIPALERCFYDRFNPLPTGTGYNLHKVQLLVTDLSHSFTKEESKQQPSNVSLIYVPDYDFNESVVNSVKEGYYTKRKTVRKNGESQLSRFQLFKSAQALISPYDAKTYVEWKSKSKDYKRAKESSIRAIGGWCPTATDDFEIF